MMRKLEEMMRREVEIDMRKFGIMRKLEEMMRKEVKMN